MPKLATPLTDIQPRTAKKGDKPYKLSDGGGLFLLINPDGSKYWRMAYRFGGVQRLLAFGKYPDISLAKARDARTAAREQINAGITYPINLATSDCNYGGKRTWFICPRCYGGKQTISTQRPLRLSHLPTPTLPLASTRPNGAQSMGVQPITKETERWGRQTQRNALANV